MTLADVGVLLVWDARPGIFPARSHDFLGAFSLAMIAVAYLAYQIVHRPPLKELAKAILLAVAFLFWAANQLWPASPQATLFNDIAIALFVFDVFLVMIGWPPTSPDSSFAETRTEGE
jgi:predicted membrane metal-binding protein